jgi:hypothetical protein
VGASEDHLHTVDSGSHLLEVAHVGADAQRHSAGMFYFQFGQVQLRWTTGKKADTGSRRRKTDRQTLADTAARTGDQDAFIS